MNDATHTAYSAYLRELANALLLADWEIQLKRELASDDCYAQVFIMNTENHAIVRVHKDFWAGSPEDRREWFIHELLHATMDRPARLMEQLSEQWNENSACQFAKVAHGKEIEICTQRLARIIAPFMPLPPEVT